jgi:hypothetical protein
MNTTPFFSGLETPVFLRILRWSARISSLLMIGTVLMFAMGEGMHLSRFTSRELILSAFFPLGVCLGMALAWRWEGLGGGITAASLAAFYLVDRLFSGGFPRGGALIVLAAPGFVFLLCWWWARSIRARGD